MGKIINSCFLVNDLFSFKQIMAHKLFFNEIKE
jgi:hypothetical protein